jgi:retron-type reverse transcriptase
MQEAEVVLGVLRERGRKSLPCTQLYRQMFNKSLYLLAYGNIYPNQGAMTPGACGDTADGMSEAKIDGIIEQMRYERYRFSPARRIWIPKKNGKLRPLGLPSWSDKLVGEVIRLLLEAIFEPVFSDSSHGFRTGRGCHTALRKIQETCTGTTWFIEGDIADCFGISYLYALLLAHAPPDTPVSPHSRTGHRLPFICRYLGCQRVRCRPI